MEKERTEEAEKTVTQYHKIEGWLVIVDLGLLLTLFRYLVLVLKDLFPNFARETFGIIMSPGTNTYARLTAQVSIIDLTINIVFFVFTVIVSVYFNQKRRTAPNLMIIYLLATLAHNTFFFVLSKIAPSLTGAQSTLYFAQSVVVTAIWVAYFKVSKRVQGTFVR